MTRNSSHVVEMYDRHPISEAQILHRLRQARGSLDGVAPLEVAAHDQDHYGGWDANDRIAECAGFEQGMHVVDFCAGLCGPARYFAHRFGVTVTAIELNESRARGAWHLNALVGLGDQVALVRGDVSETPLEDGCAGAVISQEALLHVPDKAAALSEAARILRAGGRFVFSDWVVHANVADAEAGILWRGLAAQTLQSIRSYEGLLHDAGFVETWHEDLSAQWAEILEERFRMYRELGQERRRAGMSPGADAFYGAYEVLVRLVRAGVLGGARFTTRK